MGEVAGRGVCCNAPRFIFAARISAGCIKFRLCSPGVFRGGRINMDEKDLRAEILEKAIASAPRVVKREVYDATREAREIISQAQEKAKHILEEALRERDQIQEEARQAGNVEGLSDRPRP